MKNQNVMVKGVLIFGVLGFAVFFILIVLGMAMSALGFSCDCYKIFAWSLIGIAVVSGIIFWIGSCLRNPEGESCPSVFGYKENNER